jgi:DNA polymerase elongation subunit (family B)
MKSVYTIDEESLPHLQEYLAENKPLVVTQDKLVFADAEMIVSDDVRARVYDKLHTKTERVIYGKDPRTHIVNVSIKNGMVYEFTEINGIIGCNKTPYKHYILAPIYKDGCVKLQGKQVLTWYKEYDTMAEFEAIRKNVFKYGLFTLYNLPEAYMTRDGVTYYKNMNPLDVSILSFDIETTGLDPEAEDAEVKLITNTFRRIDHIERKAFIINDYVSQEDMINSWCDWVKQVDPSIIIGHNIIMFDLVYLHTVMAKTGKSLNLGRDYSDIEIEPRTRELRKDGSQSYSYHRITCFGREIIDTFFLALKYDIARQFESYGLKPIIRQLGKEKKDRVFIDASRIKYDWEDPVKRSLIIQYGIEDSDDALVLFDLMAPVVFYLCAVVPKPFQVMTESAAGSQLNSVMCRAYLQDGYGLPKATQVEELQGAISFAIPGLYNNVLKIDFSALYPNIMMQYEVYDSEKDPMKYFNLIVNYFAENRQQYKKLYEKTKDKQHDDKQQVAKTIANSCYGFLSASGLNFNSPKQAAFITAKGREFLSTTIKWATSKDVVYWKQLFEERTRNKKEVAIEHT